MLRAGGRGSSSFRLGILLILLCGTGRLSCWQFLIVVIVAVYRDRTAMPEQGRGLRRSGFRIRADFGFPELSCGRSLL